MKNKISLQTQRIFMFAFVYLNALFTLMIFSYDVKTNSNITLHLIKFVKIMLPITTTVWILGYNLISNEYYLEKGFRIKWRFSYLGLSKVDWNKYDFHITPVLTYTRVIHPTGLANGHCIFLEWGHWALGLGRYEIKTK